MKVSDFDYHLPPEFIAQAPASPRDSSKLLHLDRASGSVEHFRFKDIARLLRPNDVLVMNNTRVIPARLAGRKAASGGKVEILLLRRLSATCWKALIRGRNIAAGTRLTVRTRLTVGTRLDLDKSAISCKCIKKLQGGEHVIEFERAIDGLLPQLGEIPLPPYIRETLAETEKYQTVYSAVAGSAAAPTAGLHFTSELLAQLRQQGVKLAYCTLHIGLDTFQPVRVDDLADHHIHSEFAKLPAASAAIINAAIKSGQRVIAVGTTSARTLESAARSPKQAGSGCQDHDISATGRCLVAPISGDTDLFIYPGYRWRIVDAMISNFHLPRSTLLMMLSAFAGRDAILRAYEIAKKEAYRFYSFGDAMFIT